MNETCSSIWNVKKTNREIVSVICELETGHNGRHRRTEGEVMYQWPRKALGKGSIEF